VFNAVLTEVFHGVFNEVLTEVFHEVLNEMFLLSVLLSVLSSVS